MFYILVIHQNATSQTISTHVIDTFDTFEDAVEFFRSFFEQAKWNYIKDRVSFSSIGDYDQGKIFFGDRSVTTFKVSDNMDR